MRISPLFLALVACAPSLSSTDDATFTIEGVEAAEPGARRSVVLTVTDLVPGGPLTFTVTGLNPAESVTIARSLAGEGAGPCLGSAQLACVGVLSPAIQGSVVADANGVATLEQTLPSFVTPGRDVWFQAVVPRGLSGASWVMSPVVATQIVDAPLNVSNLMAGDLAISEIMRDPAAVSDAQGEWFEVVNARPLDANLAGVEITDFAGDTHIIGSNVFVPAFGRVVLGREADPALNGGVELDYTYANVDLGNTIDELHLVAGTEVVDSVAWDSLSFPTTSGASMELDGEHLHDAVGQLNDVGVNWSAGSTPFGAGDLGTPGAVPPDTGRLAYVVDLAVDRLKQVDLETGLVEDVGYMWIDVSSADIAWDDRAQHMYLLGRDTVPNVSTVWEVDPSTGLATVIGVPGRYLDRLTYDRMSDRLIAAGYGNTDRGLWDIDRNTGAATFIGDPWGGLRETEGLTMDTRRNTLVAILNNTGDLVSVDLDTLTSTTLMVGAVSGGGNSLTYDPTTDTFFAWEGPDLYELDAYGAGTATLQFNVGTNGYPGLAYVPWAP